MKKIIFSLLFVFSLLAVSSNVFAYQCKDGQSLNSDECWTEVKIDPGYTTLVSRGHILVVSVVGTNVAANDGFLARHSNASTDAAILGVAQKSIASGATALVLAKGRGIIRLETPVPTIASNDILGVRASGTAAEVVSLPASANVVGTALQAGNAAGTSEPDRNTINAYIHI